jgi:hypothetical protein
MVRTAWVARRSFPYVSAWEEAYHKSRTPAPANRQPVTPREEQQNWLVGSEGD